MPLTGLFLAPLAPTSTSPLSSLLSHITLNFPCSPLPAYSVAYQLFASTSSLLPDAQSKIPRQYCQLLTTSHSPETAYIGTTVTKPGAIPSAGTELTQIIIPASSAESFVQLLNSKLQPLWAHRQTLRIEDGTSVSLRDGRFSLRVGEVKQAARLAAAASTLRGILFEVACQGEDSKAGENGSDEDDVMLRALLDRLLEGSGVKFENMRLISRYTEPAGLAKTSSEANENTRQWALAGLYMEILRETRN